MEPYLDCDEEYNCENAELPDYLLEGSQDLYEPLQGEMQDFGNGQDQGWIAMDPDNGRDHSRDDFDPKGDKNYSDEGWCETLHQRHLNGNDAVPDEQQDQRDLEEKGVVGIGSAVTRVGGQKLGVAIAKAGAGALQGGEAGSVAGPIGSIVGAGAGAIGSEFLWQQYGHHEKEIEQECRETGHHH